MSGSVNEFGMSALDPTGSGSAQVGAYGGALDLGIGGGPTGHGGFDVGLDLGPQPGGGLSLLGNGLPTIGQPSSLGGKIGSALGFALSALGQPALGLAAKGGLTYGPGAVNSLFGLNPGAGGTLVASGGPPAPGVARGGGGGSFSMGPSGPSSGGAFGNPIDPMDPYGIGLQQLAVQMSQPRATAQTPRVSLLT